VSVVLVVVLSSVISAVIGVFGLLVAQQERRKGSAWGVGVTWDIRGSTNSGGSCEIGMGDMRAGRREALAIWGAA
jgi:hypothetical protein